MERRARIIGVLCLSAGLAACGGIGTSAEDRITEAMPPGTEVLDAKAKLEALAKAQSIDDKAIQADYQARLQRRALDCAHGYQPSLFSGSDSIREALTDKDCFAKADAALRDWLGYRRIALLLGAPPLRPVPTSAPASITAADQIDDIGFADQAGVAVARIPKQFQVIDIATGATIRQAAIADGPGVSLSPNGRVFAIANGNRDTEIRDTESGDVLARFPEVRAYQFFWIGKVGAIYNPRPTQEENRMSTQPVFLDFASGQESRIPINTLEAERVVPVPGQADQVVVLGFTRAGLVQLQQGKQGWEATLKLERVMDGIGWNRGASLTADGRTFFTTAETLRLLSLSPLDSRTVTLMPLRLINAVATPDPDQVLVYGFFTNAPGGGSDYYVYSLGQRTLARVPRDQLASMRLLYIPVLKRNAVLDGAKVTVLDRVQAEAAVDVNQYLEQRAQELGAEQSARAATAEQDSPQMARARMFAKMEREGMSREMVAAAQKQHGITDAMMAQARLSPDAPHVSAPSQSAPMPALPMVKSPVAALAKNADIAAIGVYEGEVAKVRGAYNRVGTVQVHVRRTARPLILSLSSYEPVRWVITLEPGAKLTAVLTSGYSGSEVFGGGEARIFRIGQSYAYKRGGAEYTRLDDEVTRWTGKRIGSFQGSYRGNSTFVVRM